MFDTPDVASTSSIIERVLTKAQLNTYPYLLLSLPPFTGLLTDFFKSISLPLIITGPLKEWDHPEQNTPPLQNKTELNCECLRKLP